MLLKHNIKGGCKVLSSDCDITPVQYKFTDVLEQWTAPPIFTVREEVVQATSKQYFYSDLEDRKTVGKLPPDLTLQSRK